MKMFATAAGVALLAGAAFAEVTLDSATMLTASELHEDARVYSANVEGTATWDDTVRYEQIDTTWEDVGSVDDVVMDLQGNLVGIIVEVGGFLGIGDKKILLEPSEYTILTEGDDNDDFAVVMGLARVDLESRGAVDVSVLD